ncbi:hypothetical protein RRG08_066251 [Elysia crispata]|uniref:Uncharacterized protein n=1 Tax=Elysia crispata TaxID=231223 RepID=A0AAE1EEQ3_9GAST|nr:hypothetical protein RRG08_066251 [Elysia crispata]
MRSSSQDSGIKTSFVRPYSLIYNNQFLELTTLHAKRRPKPVEPRQNPDKGSKIRRAGVGHDLGQQVEQTGYNVIIATACVYWLVRARSYNWIQGKVLLAGLDKRFAVHQQVKHGKKKQCKGCLVIMVSKARDRYPGLVEKPDADILPDRRLGQAAQVKMSRKRGAGCTSGKLQSRD